VDVLLPYVKYTPWTFSSEDTLCCFSFSFPSYPGYSEALSSPSSSLLPTLPLPSLSHTIRLQRNLRGHSQRFQLRPSLYPLPSLTLTHFTSVDRFTHPLPLLSYLPSWNWKSFSSSFSSSPLCSRVAGIKLSHASERPKTSFSKCKKRGRKYHERTGEKITSGIECATGKKAKERTKKGADGLCSRRAVAECRVGKVCRCERRARLQINSRLMRRKRTRVSESFVTTDQETHDV